MTGERKLLIQAMTWECEGVVSLVLVDPSGAALPSWEPGAHIDIVVGSGIERQYSLCNSPDSTGAWRVAVLRDPASRGGSERVHTALRPGQVITVRGPRNNFALVEHTRYIFVAGGIGITPLLPMIAEVEARGAEWSLVYGGRAITSMAFTEELAAYGDKVTIWPQDTQGLIDLPAVLAPRTDAVVYCCGPEPLLTAVESHMSAWPPGSLHVERFAPKPREIGADSDGAFEVKLQSSGRVVQVDSNTSILDALEAEGIFPEASCSEGICGTCETRVLSGIPDHRDSVMTAAEHEASDSIFICVSRARSAQLVLDL